VFKQFLGWQLASSCWWVVVVVVVLLLVLAQNLAVVD